MLLVALRNFKCQTKRVSYAGTCDFHTLKGHHMPTHIFLSRSHEGFEMSIIHVSNLQTSVIGSKSLEPRMCYTIYLLVYLSTFSTPNADFFLFIVK